MRIYQSSKLVSIGTIAAVISLYGCQTIAAVTNGYAKYSPKHRAFNYSYSPEDKPKNPYPDLYSQSQYTCQHEVRVDPNFQNNEERLPLDSWKNMFVAGELAQEREDYAEATRMFKMAEDQSYKEDDKEKKKCYAWLRLGFLERKQKQYEQAEKHFKDSLVISREIKTDKGEALLQNLSELALLKTRNGQYSDAEPLLLEALATTKHYYGDVSDQTAAALNEVGSCYYYQRKFDQAQPYYYQALVIWSHPVDGENGHESTALYNLANCAMFAEKYADAEELYKGLMKGGSENYDPQITYCAKKAKEHPAPRTIFFKANGDAKVWQQFLDAGKQDLAQDRSWQAMHSFQGALQEAQSFGKQDRRYITTLAALANAESLSGRRDDAEKHYGEVAALLEKDPSILPAQDRLDIELGMADIAATHRDDGSLLKHLDQALTIADKAGAPSFEKLNTTVAAMFKHHRFEKDEHAIPFLTKLAEHSKLACGAGTPQNAIALYALAKAQGYYPGTTKTETLYRSALDIAQKSMAKDDERIADIAFDLGLVCELQRRYVDAEQPLLLNLQIRRVHPGSQQQYLRQAIDQLDGLYRDWCKPEQQEVFLAEKEKLFPISPDDSWAETHRQDRLLERSQICMDKGDLQGAEKYAEQAALEGETAPHKGEPNVGIKRLIDIYTATANYEKLAKTYARMVDANSRSQGGAANDRADQQVGVCYAMAGDYEKAIPILEKLVSDLEREGKTQPSFGCETRYPNYFACALTLGDCYLDGSDKYAQALATYEKAYGVVSKPPVLGPESFNLALCLDAMGKSDEAATKHKSIIDALSHDQSTRSDLNALIQRYRALAFKRGRSSDETLELMKTFASILHDPKRCCGDTRGTEFLMRVLAVKSQKYGQASTNLIDDLAQIGKFYNESGRWQEAEPIQNRILYIEKSNKSTPKAQLCEALLNQANTYHKSSYFSRGRIYYLMVLPLIEQQYGRNSFQYGLAEKHLGECYFAGGEIAVAEKYLQNALPLLALKGQDADRERADAFVRLALICDIQDDPRKADAYYSKGLPKEADYRNEGFTALEPLRWSAEYFKETKQYDKASVIHKRYIEILKKNHTDVGYAWEQLARMYKDAGDWANASNAYRQAISCLPVAVNNVNDADMKCSTLQEYCDVLKKANNVAELKRAEGELREVTQIKNKFYAEIQAQHPPPPKPRPIGLD
jgi:tetratricopeptide (TPR) repeat protein